MNHRKSALFAAPTAMRTHHAALPRGPDRFADIRAHSPFLEVSSVFDVDADLGQSARQFSKYFPKSEIYCFMRETCRERASKGTARDLANLGQDKQLKQHPAEY
jgi:hypothetical protein